MTPAIPRISLIWLLVAQALVILPHLAHLPLWFIGLWAFCAAWRLQIFRMRARYPNGLAKAALILATAAGVFWSRGGLIGLEAGTALLMATFVLKLVEMRTQRDALVLIYLGFFAVVTAYLLDSEMLSALYSVLPVTALLAAMVGLQQSRLAMQPWPTLRYAGKLLLQSLPLMLLLFVFFPRLGPLWSLPQPGSKGISGLAESMTPGDIANLGRSPEPVFRASFEGATPPRSELYWRALTLEHFDGRRWSQTPDLPALATESWQPQGQSLSYSILMQSSQQRWLFALDTARTDLPGARQLSDYRLVNVSPVEQPLLYRVSSWPQVVRDPELRPTQQRRALQLPAGNPRARELAAELKARYSRPEQLVAALLTRFNQGEYFYTLKPPTLSGDTVDAFLFDSRRGFCAHYAGAATFVLRAAGIPARVVAGYQGGEFNRQGGYVQVHQFDAHAWVEYWLPERGWQRVDPTFAVAPERIEQGLEAALAEEGSFLEDSPLSPLRYRDVALLNQLRLAWDNLNYGWQRWVLGYQSEQQLGLLQRWFGEWDIQRLVIVLGGGGVLLGLLMALLLLKPWQQRLDAQQRVYRRFERLLARHGVARRPGEGARDYARRAALVLPQQARQIEGFAECFEAQRYAGVASDKGQLAQQLRALRRALPWRLSRLDDGETTR